MTDARARAEKDKTGGSTWRGPTSSVEYFDFETASEVASQAFSFAEKHKTPPVPRNYELWYTYATGANPELNELINSELRDRDTLEDETIRKIYQTVLSPDRLAQGVGRVGDKLDVELEGAISVVKEALSAGEEHSEALEAAQAKLPGMLNQSGIGDTVLMLLEQNKNMLDKSTEFQNRLVDARSQVEELRNELSAMRRHVSIDHLTKLGNRRCFDETLEKAMEESQTSGSSVSMVFIDIDRFKALNDTFGHVVGDRVLKNLASILSQNTKGRDTAARYGGEEFAIILPDTPLSGAATLAEKIRADLESKRYMLKETRKSLGVITASFGVAELRKDEEAADFIARADAALYQAKETGRNRVCEAE